MSLFQPAPPPPTNLGRYRLLSPAAGVHVSPLILGAASIGDAWAKIGMGAMNKESSFKLLDAYYDNGGNFIDTANIYQDGTSEMFIGEWAEKRGIRDQLFIGTKYAAPHGQADQSVKQKIMFMGNNAKSLHVSVEQSLKRLRTTYIDILFVHFWDWDTSVEEVMRSLHHLVSQGKVLYLGICNAPAWVVSKANTHARAYGLTPFVAYQGAWSVLDRSFEQEIIPMARSEGLALLPYNVLAEGKIRTDEEEERRRQTGEKGRVLLNPNWERTEKQKLVCKALEKVAGEVGAKNITAVAIAYVMQKATYVFPIVGGRKVEYLLENIEALSISLTKDHIQYIESLVEFEPGFPISLIGDGFATSQYFAPVAHLEERPMARPIVPAASTSN